MAESGAPDNSWRETSVRIVRAASLDPVMRDPAGAGRATAFDFSGSGGSKIWIGTVLYPPGKITGAHHHGHHELAVYVVRGRSEIRWGERLEFAAEIGPGDLAYFTPFVPHQERNLSANEELEFLVIRSNNERIAEKIDLHPVATPDFVDP